MRNKTQNQPPKFFHANDIHKPLNGNYATKTLN